MQVAQFDVVGEFQIFGGAFPAFHAVQDGYEPFRGEALQKGKIAPGVAVRVLDGIRLSGIQPGC